MARRSAIVIGAAAAGVLALGAQTATAASDICIAANGEVRVQKGSAVCEASGPGSVAIAKGANSSATAIGDHNRAIVRGRGTATAIGDHNWAILRGFGT